MNRHSPILRKTALIVIYCVLCWFIGEVTLVACRTFHNPIDEYLYSLHFPFRSCKDPRIVIISIDDKATDIQGNAAYSRLVFANLIRKLEPYHPALIAFDVIFDKSINTPGDKELADAIRMSNNVILASRIMVNDDFLDIDDAIPEDIRKNALGVGYPDIYLSHFDTVNTLPMSIIIDTFKHTRVPFVFEISKHYMNTEYRAITLGKYLLGDVELPSVNPINWHYASFPIFYIGKVDAFVNVSWNDVMDSSQELASLTGAVVLVGSTSLNEDAYTTAMSFSSSSRVPGVVINANALFTLLNGKFIYTVNQSIVAVSAICAPIVSLFLYHIYSRAKAMLYSFALICLYTTIMQIIFHITLVYTNVGPPMLSGTIAAILFLFLSMRNGDRRWPWQLICRGEARGSTRAC